VESAQKPAKTLREITPAEVAAAVERIVNRPQHTEVKVARFGSSI